MRVDGLLIAVVLGVSGIFSQALVQADISDLSQWTRLQDADTGQFSGNVADGVATLSVSGGPVAHAKDIWYQSVSGPTPAASTSGYAFSPTQDFAIAISYDVTFINASGGLAIGFGIGKDGDGTNSAGVVLASFSGALLGAGGGARTNDVSSTTAIGFFPAASGSLLVSYDAGSGDVTVGYSSSTTATAPGLSHTFTGIENGWNSGDMLVSFFLRSDSTLGSAWQSGSASAAFSDFRVIAGAPVTIPEPSVGAMLTAAGLFLLRRRS